VRRSDRPEHHSIEEEGLFMRRLGLLAILALTVVAAVSAASNADAAARHTHHCGYTLGPRGEPGQGFWRKIRVTTGIASKREACRRTKIVLRAYLRTGGGPQRVRGHRCNIKIVTSPRDRDGTGHLRCVRGKRVIRATGHP
jgi:hypothetical protein